MKILIDMNLSPKWVTFFSNAGIEAVHWLNVGDPSAPDTELMRWAADNQHIIFTHDLDFGTLLALSQAKIPSVLQVRTQDNIPDALGEIVLSTIKQFESDLKIGSLITVDARRARVRLLPIRKTKT